MVGKETGVEASLQFLRAKSDDIYSEAAQIKVRPYFHSVISYVNILFDIFYYLQDYTMTIQQQPQSRFCDLFDRKYAHPLIVRLRITPNYANQFPWSFKSFCLFLLGWFGFNDSGTIWRD